MDRNPPTQELLLKLWGDGSRPKGTRNDDARALGVLGEIVKLPHQIWGAKFQQVSAAPC